MDQHNKARGFSEWGDHFVKKLDAFFSDAPTKNVMQSIDQFFENAKGPERIPVDVMESDNEWIVTVELPGVKKEQIQLEFLANQITIAISQSRETEQYDQTYNYYHKERREQKKQRTVSLPFVIDKKSTRAVFSDGVLRITGPKTKDDRDSVIIE